jgi:hypothetical protein
LAIKHILPNEEYTTWLIILCIPTVDEFIKKLQLRIFKEAKLNKDHPLHARIPLERIHKTGILTRQQLKITPNLCRTEKYKNSYLNHTINLFNNLW